MINYSALWFYFYEQWIESIKGNVNEYDLKRAREHADECIKAMKGANDVH